MVSFSGNHRTIDHEAPFDHRSGNTHSVGTDALPRLNHLAAPDIARLIAVNFLDKSIQYLGEIRHMNKADTPRLVEPILPVKLGRGNVHFAQGVKAGRWVFASGLMGQDFVHGVAPDVVNELAQIGRASCRERV